MMRFVVKILKHVPPDSTVSDLNRPVPFGPGRAEKNQEQDRQSNEIREEVTNSVLGSL